MKKTLTLLGILFTHFVFAQNKEVNAIKSILENQTASWNKGDLNSFMAGYLHSDSLVFIGKSGPTYGYDNTLANYKKSYPDTSHMGKLHFDIVSIKPLNSNHYFVIGKWFLTRTVGNVNGVFTLVLRKTKEGWKIISDHSN
jgi:ketosteroid isomerase-like protein